MEKLGITWNILDKNLKVKENAKKYKITEGHHRVNILRRGPGLSEIMRKTLTI